jgi:hypothetical protein
MQNYPSTNAQFAYQPLTSVHPTANQSTSVTSSGHEGVSVGQTGATPDADLKHHQVGRRQHQQSQPPSTQQQQQQQHRIFGQHRVRPEPAFVDIEDDGSLRLDVGPIASIRFDTSVDSFISIICASVRMMGHL